MKKFLIGAGAFLAVIFVAIAGYLVYIVYRYPDVGPIRRFTVEATPERLARGAYLANAVAVCIDCHSDRDWKKFSGPLVPGTEGQGGFCFDESFGFPGKIYAKNITPFGIGSMSDGELYSTITTGVGQNHHALFPVMPYKAYDQLSDEDLFSIIVYIRTLKPLSNAVPPTELNFPMNFIVRTIPSQHYPHQAPDTSNEIRYGAYVTTVAGCGECHTPQVRGEKVPGMKFAGGFEFQLPEGVVRSANITPDDVTGIGSWDRDLFITRFKYFGEPDSTHLSIAQTGYPSVMPWTMFAGMTARDLGAIYSYLRTLPPVHHDVTKFTSRNAAQ